MAKKAIIVGYFQEVVELCQLCSIEVVGIIDNFITKTTLQGIPVLGNDNDALKIYSRYNKIPIILSPDSPFVRKKLYQHYSKIGFSFLNLISPLAYISPSAKLGEAVFVQSNVYISSNSTIGNAVRLNVNATVMHDCNVANYCTIAPQAMLLGAVKVESLCYIGSNATILPEITVKKNAIVGAGSVVTKDVIGNSTVVGNPARLLKTTAAKNNK